MYVISLVCFFFFFQAEDGIRDLTVTGVQTCALPILPHAPLWKILIFSQVGNGVWLPVVVIFILLLVNRRDLMGEYVNTMTYNIVAWVTAIAMIAITLILIYTSLFGVGSAPVG